MTPHDFDIGLRVYWEDTDAGGVVFFANHLKFFERARTEWLRSLGFSQERMRVDDAAAFVVSETSVRYLRPARLDDWLTITVRLASVARASITIEQQAWRGDELLSEGSIRIACVDTERFALRRIPEGITRALAHTSPR
ncbi:MAG: tol-pal system-associated acyl-CoA thioesterase [Burkholderiales bacterium 28-67-8]|nr:MAG: tol-pal system-associated acyl-CoA thioesterase [Burkholderiales bacterium 28-67-8]